MKNIQQVKKHPANYAQKRHLKKYDLGINASAIKRV